MQGSQWSAAQMFRCGKHVPALMLLLVLVLHGAGLCAQDCSGTVRWVYDGDTLEVAGCGTVRLVGIDCPEKKNSRRDRDFIALGADSALQLRHSAQDTLHYLIHKVKGRTVRLELEQPSRDKYARLLAYVWLEDGTMLNRELLRQGRARVYRRFNFAYKREFLRLEQQAIASRRGMWR